MKNKGILIILFLLLLAKVNGQDAKFIDYLVDVYKNTPKHIDRTKIYEDSIDVSNFNFNSLAPIEGEEIGHTFFRVYKKGGKVKKVSRFSNQCNFDAIFDHIDNEVVFSIFVYANPKRELKDGRFVTGLFVNKPLKYIFREKDWQTYYIGFWHHIYITMDFEDREMNKKHAAFAFNSITSSVIRNCLTLSPKLFPEKQAAWLNNELLYTSLIKNNNGNIYEEVQIPLRSTADQTLDLKGMTTTNFFRILNKDIFGDGVSIYSKPKFGDKEFFFLTAPFQYINTFEKEILDE